jgi:hypothetical protein
MKNQLLLLLAAVLIIYSGCKKDDDNPSCVQGDGNIVQDTRTLDEYNAVTLNGAFNVTIAKINASQIDLFGDENILNLIRTPVVNKSLTVGTENNVCYETQNTIEVTLSTPLLNSIVFNGAGMITGLNLVQDNLSFQTNGAAQITSAMTVSNLTTVINGAGDANLQGSATIANFTITGAGNIFASTLDTDECTIVISGTGDVRVHVNNKLNVTISGTGSVYYTGDPDDIVTNITGTGSVVDEG